MSIEDRVETLVSQKLHTSILSVNNYGKWRAMLQSLAGECDEEILLNIAASIRKGWITVARAPAGDYESPSKKVTHGESSHLWYYKIGKDELWISQTCYESIPCQHEVIGIAAGSNEHICAWFTSRGAQPPRHFTKHSPLKK